jgi:hypothetical protein
MAEKASATIVTLWPKSARSYLWRATALQTFDPAAAEAAYRKALEIDADSDSADLLAELMFTASRHGEGITILREAEARRPEPKTRGARIVFGKGWCRDVFAHHADPRLPGTGERAGLDEVEHRIRRGGAFFVSALEPRSARRNLESPLEWRLDTGVRPARPLER